MNFIDKFIAKRFINIMKSYSDAGSLTNYDRSFFDFMGALKAGSKDDYSGAIFNAMEVHGFYFSKAKFRLYTKHGDEAQELINHPFTTMFIKPNSQKTWWETAYKIPIYWGLWGVNYFHVKRNILTNIPFAYQQLPPALIEKEYDKTTGVLSKYTYNDGVNKIPLKIEDMIEIKYPNPYSENEGFPIIESIADQKTVNKLQMHYMKKFFENGGFMGLVFTTKQEMRKINFDRTLLMLEEKFKGKDKAYKEVGLFDSGLQPVKASYSIKDMDITESRKLTKDDIYEAWKVHKIHIGSAGAANRAESEAAVYQFTSGVIDPLLSFIDNSFSLFAQKEWGDDSLQVIHDSLAPKDIEGQLGFYEKMSKLGALTINEIREEQGYNKFDYELADKPIINVGGSIVRIDTGKQIGVEDTQQEIINNEVKNLIQKDAVEDWRILKWKQFNSRHGFALRRFEKTLDRYFGDQERRILEAVLNNYIVEQAFNLEDENMILYQFLEIDIWDIMREGHKFGSFQFDSRIDFSKDILRPEFDKITNTTLKINETTFSSIKGLTTESQLQKAYREIKENRLGNIAVTTTTGAFNAGLLRAMKDAGLTKKTWLSMRDTKVRDYHKLMDGVTVPLDEPFEVEARGLKSLGLYPGDPVLGAVNNARCRCTIIGE